jgi:hypothetical protein
MDLRDAFKSRSEMVLGYRLRALASSGEIYRQILGDKLVTQPQLGLLSTEIKSVTYSNGAFIKPWVGYKSLGCL